MLELPEPYQTKARALLKPWHPFFEFSLSSSDGDLVFEIRFRRLLCRDKWTHESFPQERITGVFPFEAFERHPDKGFERFSLCVFRSLTRLVSEALWLNSPALAQVKLVNPNGLDWESTIKWAGRLTEPLTPWFDRDLSENHRILSLTLSQPLAEYEGKESVGWLHLDVGQQLKPWHAIEPFDALCLPIDEITNECHEHLWQQGIEKADALLKKLIIERITNALYFMKLAL